jgi:glucose/arabinose dehydrogenase
MRVLFPAAPAALLLLISSFAPTANSPAALAAFTDTDRDGVSDAAELNCGSDPSDSRARPERTDDVFAGVDDDADGSTDEVLPNGAGAYDCDGDGYTGDTEAHVFGDSARDQDACGLGAWPSELISGSIPDSTDRLTIGDLSSFVAPTRHLGTAPGDLNFDQRWDLTPGTPLGGAHINVLDMSAMIAGDSGSPPMLAGRRAFNSRHCPWPLTANWSASTSIPGVGYSRMVALVPVPGSPDEAIVVSQDDEIAYRVSLTGAFTPTVFGDLTTLVGGGGNEEGLLALAFPPRYPGDSRVYTYYTQGSPQPTVLARFNVVGGVMDIGSVEQILTIPSPQSNHNGGQLAFGPDGYLYLSLGDGGGAGDPLETGQDNTDLLGSVLRIDVSGASGYTVPVDNPFVSVSGADEVWAYGLRNPWRFSFDTESGELWLADVGQNAWEEIDSIVPGGNYGWDCYEGLAEYETLGCPAGGFVEPRAVYGHALGCSITGGFVYHGAAYPELTGRFIYGDYCSGRIWAVNAGDSSSPATVLIDTPYNIASFGQLPDGEIVVVTFGNAIYRIERD